MKRDILVAFREWVMGLVHARRGLGSLCFLLNSWKLSWAYKSLGRHFNEILEAKQTRIEIRRQAGCWLTPGIPALRKPRQEDCPKYEASLGDLVSSAPAAWVYLYLTRYKVRWGNRTPMQAGTQEPAERNGSEVRGRVGGR